MQGRIRFLAFSTGSLPFLAVAPPPSSKCITVNSYLVFTLPSLSLILLPPSIYKDPYDYIGPTQLIQDNLLISRFLTHQKKKKKKEVFLAMWGNIFLGPRNGNIDSFGRPLFNLPHLISTNSRGWCWAWRRNSEKALLFPGGLFP